MTPKFYSKVKKMLYISNVELIKFKFFLSTKLNVTLWKTSHFFVAMILKFILFLLVLKIRCN